jgi:hypothetical protein
MGISKHGKIYWLDIRIKGRQRKIEASGSQRPLSPGFPGLKKTAERISGSLGETIEWERYSH